MRDRELHERALRIVTPALSVDREEARAQLRSAANTAAHEYSDNLEDILRAAEDGRIDRIFLSPKQTVWGHYDAEHRVIRIDQKSEPDNEDLLNLAALRTLARGGAVYSLPNEVDKPVQALFRY
jgi:hypothetical protein